MTEPHLPPVSENTKERVYRPSGKCTLRSFVQIVGVGLPIAIVIGIIGQYIGQWILPLGKFIGTWLQDTLIWYRFCCIIPGILVAFVLQIGIIAIFGLIFLSYPLLLGGAIGLATTRLIHWEKCRAPYLAAVAGFLNGIVGYGSLALLRFHLLGHADTSSGLVPLLELVDIPWWIYVLIGLDVLATVSVAMFIPANYVFRHPFCETCVEWYDASEAKGLFCLEITAPLVETLESGVVHPSLENISAAPNPPLIEVKLAKCSSCAVADVQLEAYLTWEEVTKNSQGQDKTRSITKQWILTMLPAQLAVQLDETLGRAYDISSEEHINHLPKEQPEEVSEIKRK